MGVSTSGVRGFIFTQDVASAYGSVAVAKNSGHIGVDSKRRELGVHKDDSPSLSGSAGVSDEVRNVLACQTTRHCRHSCDCCRDGGGTSTDGDGRGREPGQPTPNSSRRPRLLPTRSRPTGLLYWATRRLFVLSVI